MTVQAQDVARWSDRAAFALAASALAVRPLCVFEDRRLAPSLILSLVPMAAFLLWGMGRLLSSGGGDQAVAAAGSGRGRHRAPRTRGPAPAPAAVLAHDSAWRLMGGRVV